MDKSLAGAVFLATALLLAQPGAAAVVMCTDPVSGKKTFTDKGCPDAGTGKKVRVEPTNFNNNKRCSAGKSAGRGSGEGTWNSDRDRSVAGRENLAGHSRHIDSAQQVSGSGR